ncbi:MAG: Ethanolamine ammonia-lyase light chain [Mucilaginibacter sp.]|nr:Ethanolamine ammonia-lyase light chain [Mucilaginibacter sp.]
MKKVIKASEPLIALQQFTSARIAIGRTGTSIPLKQSLEFKLAHAHARDAVYSELDVNGLTESLKQFNLPIVHLHSMAGYREQYLQRPDLGRKLNEESIAELTDRTQPKDIAIIIADGLSATAINTNVAGLLKQLIPMLASANFKFADIVLVKQARVAIGDEIASGLKAKLSLVLIGERPGLSSADSIGAYLTYDPKPGLTDELRNCVSNIRPNGLNYQQASKKIFYLVQEAFKRKLSGVGLKDNAGLLPGK